MIDGIKPYAAYKDSRVPWLGEIPEHWEVQPALAVYRPKAIKNIGMLEKTVLSLSYGRIIIKPAEKLHGLVPESFETYQIVDPGDIIVRTTDLQNDKVSLRVGYANDRGIITSAYMCLETTEGVSSEFGYQFLNTYDLLKIIYGFGSGLRQNLDFWQIKRMPVLVPPLSEQSAIVRFLDHADQRMRRYIRTKQKLIKLIEEQRQAVIDNAVSCGVNPSVRRRPSRVEWLDDVPEHWQVTRLVQLATRIGDGLHGTPVYSDGSEYSFINGNNLSRGVIKITPSTRSVSESEFHKFRLDLDDSTILMSINGTIGNLAFYRDEQVVLGKSAAFINCKEPLLRSFLFFVLQSSSAKAFFRSELTGTTIFNLSLATIRNLPIALPSLQEQLAIVTFLDTQTSKFDSLIEHCTKAIALFREYRTGLIAGVVTGKLDVREAAARLPAELLESEPLDEINELLQDDLAADDVEAEAVEDI